SLAPHIPGITGEDLIFQHLSRHIQVKVRRCFPQSLILIMGEVSKHTAVFHIVAVYNGVLIREIRLVIPVRKDTATAVVLPGKQMMQIISIIGSLYHRITDG